MKLDLSAFRPKTEIVEIPERGSVRVRELSISQRNAITERSKKEEGEGGVPLFVLLCAQGWVDDDGNRIFGDDDLDKLGEISAGVVDTIAQAIMALSRVKSDKEDTEKND